MRRRTCRVEARGENEEVGVKKKTQRCDLPGPDPPAVNSTPQVSIHLSTHRARCTSQLLRQLPFNLFLL